jgi:hypothetical protein
LIDFESFRFLGPVDAILQSFLALQSARSRLVGHVIGLGETATFTRLPVQSFIGGSAQDALSVGVKSCRNWHVRQHQNLKLSTHLIPCHLPSYALAFMKPFGIPIVHVLNLTLVHFLIKYPNKPVQSSLLSRTAPQIELPFQRTGH